MSKKVIFFPLLLMSKTNLFLNILTLLCLMKLPYLLFFYPSICNIHMNLLLYFQVSIIHEFRIFIWDYLQSIGTRTTFIWSPCVQNLDFILREIFLHWWCKKNYVFSWIVYSNSGFVADVDMVRYAWVIN